MPLVPAAAAAPLPSGPAPLLAMLADGRRSRLLKQGAEAKVFSVLEAVPTRPSAVTYLDAGASTEHAGAPPGEAGSGRVLLKYRFPKTYRHPTLSATITAQRTAMEARALLRCAKAGVAVPAVRCVDEKSGVLGLEWIAGRSVREWLGGGAEGDDEAAAGPESGEAEGAEGEEEEDGQAVLSGDDQLRLMDLIGAQIAHMHSIHVIHGDLTTSNLMLRPCPHTHIAQAKGKAKADSSDVQDLTRAFLTLSTDGESDSQSAQAAQVVLIDFGLSSVSTLAEDKAVDLYVLERAFASTHPASGHLFTRILDVYFAQLERRMKGERVPKGGVAHWIDVRRKLDEVRLRGRKRSMVG
ncbi:hypothetical protein K437DRAFT_257025 [Tilletiaria anomala UBC 951]|uniref:non-specific serine/threonine protein kinase n=1 Tax=Tilletiaria anomala (strain ATCC 24038 / CBS 436.72 / UBC 951) TaxID=1037660 RepID=A0A066W0B4_TILAU|nr:uncharacterized protein K437DRAFT_257025 [Tilletiaria anomala UBC 951]KDN44504.1 hypothetical protein K437DRAFT_257025 [Tilletiaria anomala UBC 951]